MLDVEEQLLGFADALAVKAAEHTHYAFFENDELAAAEHRGIANAFAYVSDVVRRAAEGDDGAA